MVEATAHGKHLFCEFDGDRFLHVHLGLIGSFELGPPDPPRGEVRARIATGQAAADLRGPQLCVLSTRAEVASQVAVLGPDPLRADADPDLAWRRIHRATRPIAALLMDQTILSGVGNVYRAEVLFRNRIDPHRPGQKLSRRSWQGIWTDLVELMPQGVADNRIDTVRPEHTPEAMGRPPVRMIMAVRSMCTGAPAWPAWSAAPRYALNCSPVAICSGVAGANVGDE